jgi:hypothetical protein
MKKIYVDHHVLIRYEDWPELRAVFAPNAGVRLVLSEWNLFEIANYGDRKEVFRRAAFLDSLKPLWIMERLQILKAELRSFIYQTYYNTENVFSSPFSDSLSVIVSYNLGSKTPLCLTASELVRVLAHPYSKNTINATKPLTTNALTGLQAAGIVERDRVKSEVFRRHIYPLLPTHDPQNQVIKQKEKSALLQHCESNKIDFYTSCSAFRVENALYEIRPRDPNRKPKLSDGIDLQHSTLALAYCDYFVTRDGFVRQCCQHVTRSGRSRCQIVLDLRCLKSKLKL